MKVKRSIIPLGTVIETFLPADYLDAYRCRVDKKYTFSPEDIMVAIWTDFTPQVGMLFKVRNFFVKLLELKYPRKEDLSRVEDCIRKGYPSDFLSRATKSKEEVVLIMNDKHLDAYFSVYIGNHKGFREVYSITVVHFHNQFGRFYFWLVRPFHHLILKNLFKRALYKHIHPIV